jgi:acetylornithine deacetylase/succinyl-diaminopimelate desuccinylase-like protein
VSGTTAINEQKTHEQAKQRRGAARKRLQQAMSALALVAGAQLATAAEAPQLRPDQLAFRALFKELVETNTTISSGSCTLAAERMAAHLKKAGFKDEELFLFSTPEHPKDGGLVATIAGSSPALKPMLLLAHIDVVEANREDWVRDPFIFVEENGYYYARGVVDDKAQAAIWTDMFVRFKQDGYRPARTIRMALTCGEETSQVFNGAEWLAKNRKDLVDVAFVLNEGGGGRTDGSGRIVSQGIQVGEKHYQDFLLETTSPGGHSSIPVRENAFYQMAEALLKVRDHEFPLMMSDTTRTFLARAGAMRGDELGDAMVALSKNPDDKAAEAIVNADRSFNSMLRTTCVATTGKGGHAENALPQSVTTNVNCRIFPGVPVAEVQAALVKAIDDPGVKVTLSAGVYPVAVPPPLDPAIIGPMETLSAKYFPGVPVLPIMSTGATDAVHFGALKVPVYGVPGIWLDSDLNGIHGLNERIEIRSIMTGRDYLTDLVKLLADER